MFAYPAVGEGDVVVGVVRELLCMLAVQETSAEAGQQPVLHGGALENGKTLNLNMGANLGLFALTIPHTNKSQGSWLLDAKEHSRVSNFEYFYRFLG